MHGLCRPRRLRPSRERHTLDELDALRNHGHLSTKAHARLAIHYAMRRAAAITQPALRQLCRLRYCRHLPQARDADVPREAAACQDEWHEHAEQREG